LDGLAELGFDWLWFLSVWQTGSAAQAISRANPEWPREFGETLPDLKEEDIAGSGFAIQNYTVHRDLGGAAALARLRERMQRRGLKLMLDFIPNHMAPDHPWIDEHPDYFVHGSESDLARAPQNYCGVQTKNGPLVVAYGRDPYFDGWPDTLQLNYGNPQLQQAMIDELESIARQPPSLRSCRPDCASFIKGNWKGEENGFRPIWSERRRSLWSRGPSSSMTGYLPSCAVQLYATASGNCSSANPPGMETGPRIVSGICVGR
jgi:glycosidase